MKLSFYVQGTQTSAQAFSAHPCRTADLIGDARAQAINLASAAGFGLGGVVAVSDSSAAPVATILIAAGIGLPGFTFSEPARCSISVKFRLLQN